MTALSKASKERSKAKQRLTEICPEINVRGHFENDIHSLSIRSLRHDLIKIAFIKALSRSYQGSIKALLRA
jgi:hypothetical protein